MIKFKMSNFKEYQLVFLCFCVCLHFLSFFSFFLHLWELIKKISVSGILLTGCSTVVTDVRFLADIEYFLNYLLLLHCSVSTPSTGSDLARVKHKPFIKNRHIFSGLTIT